MSTPSESHNRSSLQALLRHIDEQCRGRVESIRRRAADEAATIIDAARGNAAGLLRETRRRERRAADDQVRAERARHEARIRQRQLALQRERARRGLSALREALRGSWARPAARSVWLARVLADARAVLPSDRWCIRHPTDWTPDERTGRAAREAAPGVRLEWRADPSLTDGFVVEAGAARVDATIDGLTARDERIVGLLLAELPEPNLEIGA
jgi:hypothetical protein